MRHWGWRERPWSERGRLSSGVSVDANVMNLFSGSLIQDEITDARTLVERIKSSHGFAIDVGGKIQHQWLETCDKTFFGQWFVEGLKAGWIRQVAAKTGEADAKKLRIGCGMPSARHELAYIAVANVVTPPRYIVTDDIDFWEPKAKAADEKRKQEIKTRREGCVCQHLRKMKIVVGTVAQALAEL